MKSATLVISMILISVNIYALINGGNVDSSALKTGSPIEYNLYVKNDILFYPKSDKFNKPKSEINYCSNFTRNYIIDGLELGEKMFLKLDLNNKYITNKSTYYEYIYQNESISNCILIMNMYLSVNIPILLNNVLIKPNDYQLVLKQIKSREILTIKRKNSLFKKSVIEITTLNKNEY